MIANITTETPAAVDAVLVEIHSERAALMARLAVLDRDEAQISKEFSRRGGWTRTYLVEGGHLHTSTACSTCFPTTRFYFMADLSGMTEAEIVEAAGERACTVCFPSAPVDVLKRKSALRTPGEKAADEARAEKAAKREQAAAAAINVEGLKEFSRRRIAVHTFKSERALSNFIAGKASSLATWGGDHPTADEWTHDLTVASEALAAYRSAAVDSYVDPREIAAEALAKAEKRVAAERRRYGR